MAALEAHLDQNETLRTIYDAALLASGDHDSSEPAFVAALAVLQHAYELDTKYNSTQEKFVRGCMEFVHSWMMVGFGIVKAQDAKTKLLKVLEDYRVAVAELEEPTDLLGKVLYVLKVYDDKGEVIGFKGQPFDKGRPASKEVSYKTMDDARMGATYFGAVLVETSEFPKPYLYILMRNDIGSMNPGKAVAQGTHAANQMIFEAMIATDPMALAIDKARATNLAEMVAIWSREARGFGTCICLGANEKQMRTNVASALAAGLHAGITHDPSYPVKDGGTFYTIPMDTCAYIFDYQAVVRSHVSDLSLLP